MQGPYQNSQGYPNSGYPNNLNNQNNWGYQPIQQPNEQPNQQIQQRSPPLNIRNNFPNPNDSYGFQSQAAAMMRNQNGGVINSKFDDNLEPGLLEQSRKGFISKVYALLSIQMLVTVIIGYFGYNSPSFQRFFGTPVMAIVISVALLALSIVIGCCTDFFRRYALPIFILFTVLQSLLVAIAIAGYQSSVVLMAVVFTLAVTIGLTLFACFSNVDSTTFGPYLFILSLVLLVFGVVAIFWNNPIVQLVYAGLSALLFGIYLIYDTQMVVGKHQFSYSLDDAYFAAIQLYIDIIQLFLAILRITGAIQS